MRYETYINQYCKFSNRLFYDPVNSEYIDPITASTEFLTLAADKIAKTYHDNSGVAQFEKIVGYLSNLYRFANQFFSLVDRSDPAFTLFDKLLCDKIGDTLPNGELIGYKKALLVDPYCNHRSAIVKLRIPDHAMRSRAFSMKCRCSEAIVEGIYSTMNPNIDLNKAYSTYMKSFVYETGKTVRVNDFDICPWVGCSTGIHFFMDEQDAINYCI